MKQNRMLILTAAKLIGVSTTEVITCLKRLKIQVNSLTPYGLLENDVVATVFLELKGGGQNSAKSKRSKSKPN